MSFTSHSWICISSIEYYTVNIMNSSMLNTVNCIQDILKYHQSICKNCKQMEPIRVISDIDTHQNKSININTLLTLTTQAIRPIRIRILWREKNEYIYRYRFFSSFTHHNYYYHLLTWFVNRIILKNLLAVYMKNKYKTYNLYVITCDKLETIRHYWGSFN